MKIVVMGQGYVGLPLAMAAAKAGHHVVGYEPDGKRYTQLASGISYVEDVDSGDMMRRMEEGLYMPSMHEQDLVNFDVAVITVPTPLKHGVPDLSYIKAAATTLGLYLRESAVVILESTVAPGTTRNEIVPLLEIPSELEAGEDFHVGFSPERIDPGNKAWTFENTPKIVAGLTTRCRNIVATFYSTITETVVTAGSLEAAELTKVFENTYRQVNIALVNELQRHAHALGVNVWETLDLADTKPFGFTKFTPGPGVGGHCLPVDPMYLAHQTRTVLGEAFRIVELAHEINQAQPMYVVRRLQDALNLRCGKALKGATILALGLAYKPGSGDMRESPAAEVVELLRANGAKVDTVDPFVDGDDLYHHNHDTKDAADYDAVVLLTAHPEFDLAEIADRAFYVLDTRGVMPTDSHIERL